jgi:uncharacterized protein
MLRSSSYTIYIDLPRQDERMLLLHGYTGAYDLVSRRVATYLRSLEARRPPKPLYGTWSPEPVPDGEPPAPSAATIEVLRRRGYLTPLSVAEEEDLFVRLVNRIHEHQRNPVYVIVTTYNCNLRCSYCFQSRLRDDRSSRPPLRAMSREMADRLFLAIPRIEALQGQEAPPRRRSFSLFGGEPLLRSNRGLVKHIIDRARTLGEASFWVITNGTDLDAYQDLLGPDGIASLQITLDGPPEAHDKRRIYPNGKGSFSRIADNVTMALERGAAVSIRINVDRTNLDDALLLGDEIAARGWPSYQGFNAYVAAVRAETAEVDEARTLGTWELYKILAARTNQSDTQRVLSLPDEYLKHQARSIFQREPSARPALRSAFCAAHTGMYLFDALGDLYACLERIGNPSLRIGRLAEDGEVLLDDSATKMWRSRNVAASPACRKCRYALYCGGGCAVQAEQKTSSFFASYCDGFAARFRNAVAQAYRELEDGTAASARPGKACDM